jgi:hypothetical protein
MMLPDDFEVSETGTHKTLDAQSHRIIALREALWTIISQESCLLADAKETAAAAIKRDDEVTQI